MAIPGHDGGGNRIGVKKRYENRTSPQGSILSPALWRAFDAVFSHIYCRALDELFDRSNGLEKYVHVSYADDHVTVAALRIKISATAAEIDAAIQNIALTCRQLLDMATKATGCGVNQKKSEILLANRWCTGTWCREHAKEEMVWLGHSIKINDLGYLLLTETRMRQRFGDVRNKLSNVYQYIGDVGIRMKIWKTYISPVIDWFAPVAFTKPYHDMACANELEVFQQQTLCWAMKVSRNAPRREVDDIACERPVKYRCMTIAARLSEYAHRTDAQLTVGSTATYASEMTLRGGKRKNAAVEKWPAAKRMNIGDRV